MLDSEQVEELTLTHANQSIELSREGNHLVAKRGPPGFGRDQIENLKTTLGDLQAEAAVHVGQPLPSEGLAQPTLRVSATLVDPSGTERRVAYRIGAGDAWRNVSVYYARLDGGQATYVIARSRVLPLLRIFGD